MNEVTRKTKRLAAIAYALLLSFAMMQPVGAAVISTSASDFAAFSGGNFSSGTNVTINGVAGASGTFDMNNNGLVTGTIYSGGNLTLQNGITAQNLISNNAIWVNNNSTVGTINAGGTTGLSLNASSGSIKSTGDVNISQNANVTGNINTAGSVYVANNASITQGVSYGTTYWAENGAKVGGNVSQAKSPTPPDSWTNKLLSNPGISNSNTSSLYYSPSTTASLAAGVYGNLSMDQGTKLTLTAGTYNFQSLYLAQKSQLLLDTSKGNIIILVAGTVSTADSVSFLNQSKGSLSLQSAGTVYLGTNNTFNGSLTTFSSMSIDQSTTINGSAYASGDMYLNNKVVINYIGSPSPALSGVPEPASFSLLAVGSLVLMRRTKRSKNR